MRPSLDCLLKASSYAEEDVRKHKDKKAKKHKKEKKSKKDDEEKQLLKAAKKFLKNSKLTAPHVTSTRDSTLTEFCKCLCYSRVPC